MDEPGTSTSHPVANNRPVSYRTTRRRRRYSFAMRYSSLAALMGLFFLLWPRPADVSGGGSAAASAELPMGLELVGLGFLLAMLLFSAFAVTTAIRHTRRHPPRPPMTGETIDAVPALPVTRGSVSTAKEASPKDKDASAGNDALSDEQLHRLNFQRWRYTHGQLTEFPDAPPSHPQE